MDKPAITVVLPTWDTFDALRTTITHLGRQTIADRIELLICAPEPDRFVVDDEALAPLHSTRVLDAGDLTATGPARARAIREARADVIAFTEDHCFPDPPWAEALLRAHEEPHAAIAPAMRNANPETLVSWADLLLGYGRWLAPGRRGLMEMLPGHNISYKRRVLLDYDGDLDRLMEAETVLMWELRSRGHTLLFEPAATTAHTNFSRMAVWLDAQWHLGRVFAATRAAEWPRAKRAAYAAATPAIPLIRLYHIVRYGSRNGVSTRTIASTLPVLAIGLAVDFVAQATGALFGNGASVARLSAYEFHRAEVNRTGRPPVRV
jgi:Glycosyl transferase family 2